MDDRFDNPSDIKGRVALLYNAGCKEQVFSLKFRKKNWRRSILSFSRKTFDSKK